MVPRAAARLLAAARARRRRLRLGGARRAAARRRARLVAAAGRGARRAARAGRLQARGRRRGPGAPGSSPSGSASPDELVAGRRRDRRDRRGACALPAAPRHLALERRRPVLVPAEDADALLASTLPGGAAHDARPPAASRTTPPRPAAASSSPTSSPTRSPCSRTAEPVTTIAIALQPGGVTPLDRGRQVAVVSVRERVVEMFDVATGRAHRPRARRRRPDARRLRRRQLPVRHRHDRRRAARLPPAPEARADPPLPAARLALRDRDRQPPPPHVRHPDRAQPAHRADRRRPAQSSSRRYATPRQPNTVAVDETHGTGRSSPARSTACFSCSTRTASGRGRARPRRANSAALTSSQRAA